MTGERAPCGFRECLGRVPKTAYYELDTSMRIARQCLEGHMTVGGHLFLAHVLHQVGAY
jgi:hypothetical protein